MKAYIDCVHCYLKQAVTCMTLAEINEDRQHEILFELMDNIKKMDRNNTPAENSTEILLKVYRLLGNSDPYKEAKQYSNDLALKIYPKLKELLEQSDDRLYDALKIAVAGNIIDMGINRTFDINESLKYSLRVGFSRDNYDLFVKKLQQVDEVVILGDNSGEIVFDKILVEELVRMGKKIIYVVKDSPILNDATMDDAIYVGMDKIARVITTGSNYLGAPLNRVSPTLLNLLQQAKLVISKGQANFESLEQEEIAKNKIFFLLKIKCDGVGRVAGAKLGDVVFFVR
ncbi:damage-control phosphatase ARMT1 family protein [Desulfotomaculum nigrificans]|uniref:damage-control phosphatase ARMT1 family protein n=1 Tax=Desulfotomaculum nigrificans TaxID=1565 RepID=UPI0001FAE7AA|nr:ARMT1-like domain-containing protein [Desulfotomaculum nigrificans]